MLKKILCLIIILSGTLCAAGNSLQILRVFYPYEGDCYHQFRSNLVATLSDGSSWKIHPKDHDIIQYWNINDTVHVDVRTSFYWFNREHKFKIVNHSREEEARVMLVEYPLFPTTVITSIRYRICSFVDEIFYNKYLLLSDGTICKIPNSHCFKNGDAVYLGFNNTFIITGIEREAVWEWIDEL